MGLDDQTHFSSSKMWVYMQYWRFFVWPHEAASGQPDLHARVRGASQLTAAEMVAAAAVAVSHGAAVMAAAVAAAVPVEGYPEGLNSRRKSGH